MTTRPERAPHDVSDTQVGQPGHAAQLVVAHPHEAMFMDLGPLRTPPPPLLVEGERSTGTGFKSAALPLLRADEEPILGFWIEAGRLAAERLASGGELVDRADLVHVQSLGERALERMTRSNIRLVYYWIGRSWTGRDTGDLDDEDLAMAGIEGLIHAIWMWDYQRGLKFSTYATWWIRQSLDRAVIKARGLSGTHPDTVALNELFRIRVQIEGRLGRAATHRELANALQITVAGVRDLLLMEKNVSAPERLDRPLGEEGTATFGDLLPHTDRTPEQAHEDEELHDELAAALQQLTPRERAVVSARVGWSGPVESEEDLASRFGVTVEQVRATAQAALIRLRDLLGDSLELGAAA